MRPPPIFKISDPELVLTKGIAEDKLEILNDSALELTKRGELSGDRAVFLRELGVAEDLDSISRKCRKIKKTIAGRYKQMRLCPFYSICNTSLLRNC